ncbi:MAG: AIM24 family protein [Bradymonadaceae bacterium]
MADQSDGRSTDLARRNNGAPKSTGRGDSVREALETLEREELARYCRDISIDGVIAQSVSLDLDRNHRLWAAKGSLLSYTPGIEWSLEIPGGAGKAVSRMLSGEGLSMTRIKSTRDGESVVLGANQPGQLVTWDLSKGPIVCSSGAFVGALGDVDIDVKVVRNAGAALFGGGGLFMQRLSGEGIAIIHGAGDFIERRLGAGEKLLVSTGNLAVFSGDVDYSIRRTGGCLKSIFGSEGFFMTEMSGPGWVMLQSLKKLGGQQDGGQQGGE